MNKIAVTAAVSHLTDTANESSALKGTIAGEADKLVLQQRTNKLSKTVQYGANLPSAVGMDIVPSAAMDGLRLDYLRHCTIEHPKGGLNIVYEGKGMGKSHALQGVAREKSLVQPPRFLTLTIGGMNTCDAFYKKIRQCAGLDCQGFSPEQVARAFYEALVGIKPGQVAVPQLPGTDNKCRLTLRSTVPVVDKKKDYPILVIDEFTPIDFGNERWPDAADFTREQLVQDDKMGASLKFFGELTDLAYQKDGFVIFVSTRSKAVTKALLKINGGDKAALARSTKRANAGNLFPAWQGFGWSDKDKENLLEKIYKRAYQELLRNGGTVKEHSIEGEWNAAVQECIGERTIRDMCDAMDLKKGSLEVWQQVLMTSGTVDNDDLAGGCCADVADQVKNACVTM